VRNSSTSSSSARRLPWAGLLALALLLAVDRIVFGVATPWTRLALDDPHSAASSRLELSRLGAAPAGRPRVAVVGTSRVIDGFDKPLAEQLMPGVAFAKLAYPRFEPFVIRALVGDLLDARVDAVALMASELDTHRPLRLEPVPGSSAASLGALWDLLEVTDLRFAVENRTSLYRLAATSLLQTYRYRLDLRLAGLDAARRFESEPRLAGAPAGRRDPFRPVALWGASRHRVAEAAQRSTFDLFPPLMDQWKARIQAGTAQEITPGEHVAVQMHLYRRAIQELRDAGVEVVVLQGTMHPAARDLYDPQLRDEFVDFARGLADELGVRFVPLTHMPPLAESDFYDLIHTTPGGAAKLTRTLVRELRKAGLPEDLSAG
jgi:hypothetical protein